MGCNCGGSTRVRERRQAQIAAREARKAERDAKAQKVAATKATPAGKA